MDKVEAGEILAGITSELRTQSYEELRGFLPEPHMREVAGAGGATYQVEVQAFWDDRQETNLRVMVSIDDGGLSAFRPLSGDFIIAPDGSFVGE